MAKRRFTAGRKPGVNYWSDYVTRHSNALDLDRDVFRWKDPRRIARSLQHSAEVSDRRKAEPFRSAMSMLNFYINRAGVNLAPPQRRILERAKDELRRLYGRPKGGRPKTAVRRRSSRGPSRRPSRARA